MKITGRVYYSGDTLDEIHVRRQLDDRSVTIDIAGCEMAVHTDDLPHLLDMLSAFADEIRREEVGDE